MPCACRAHGQKGVVMFRQAIRTTAAMCGAASLHLLLAAAASAAYVEVPLAGSAVTASTSDGNVPANAVDNNLSTRWSGSGDGAWIRFDLGTVRRVGYVGIAVYGGNARQNSFDLQVSSDGSTWADVITGGATSGTTTLEQNHDFADVDARYVRYVRHRSTAGTSTA